MPDQNQLSPELTAALGGQPPLVVPEYESPERRYLRQIRNGVWTLAGLAIAYEVLSLVMWATGLAHQYGRL